MGIFDSVATAVAASDKYGRVPPGSPDPDWGKLTGLGDPVATWAYRDGLGLLGYVARWETSTGKTIRQFTWRGNNWHCTHFAKPAPLYGLDRLAERTHAPVLIVEGEKCADTAAALLPDYVCITWPGGSNAVAKADWAALGCRDITIWPDADEPGVKAAAAIVWAVGRCTVLDVGGKPDKWDVADAVADGWDTAAARAFIAERGRMQGDEGDDGWADPDDLVQVGAGDPYPVEALPPVMLAAVREVQAYVKAPVAMVAGAALGALSMAAQGLLDVDRDSITTGPCSLFLLTIAESGERKSSCDGYFWRGITQWERDRAAALAPAVVEAMTRLEAWSENRDGLKAMIKLARRNPSKGSVADLTAELVAMNDSKPKLVQVPSVRHVDTTSERLGYNLATAWPSGAIATSEGGLVFGAYSMGRDAQMRNMALYDVLWDGTVHTVKRTTSPDYTIDGARLTISIQTQESVLRGFVDGSAGLARGIGFIARLLIAWPESTQGGRAYCEATPMPAVDRFNERVRGLLDTPLPLDGAGRLVPVRVRLDPAAKAVWVAYHDAQEARLGPQGDLADVRDVASKSADNAARLAGLIHALAWGSDGQISADSMARACTLAAWYLGQAQRLFAGLATDPRMKAAVLLDRWLVCGPACKRDPVSGVIGVQ